MPRHVVAKAAEIPPGARKLVKVGERDIVILNVKGELFARAAAEDWIVVLSHEPLHPVGRIVAERDRYAFEPS